MNKLLCNNIADFVFGSRYMKDASSDDDTLITYVGNKIFSFLGNVFFFTHEVVILISTYKSFLINAI